MRSILTTLTAVAIVGFLSMPSAQACDTLGVCAQQVYAAPLVAQQYVAPIAVAPVQQYVAPVQQQVVVQRQVAYAQPVVQQFAVKQVHAAPLLAKARFRPQRQVVRQRSVVRGGGVSAVQQIQAY